MPGAALVGNVSKERNEQRGKSLQLLPRNKEPFLKIAFQIIFPSSHRKITLTDGIPLFKADSISWWGLWRRFWHHSFPLSLALNIRQRGRKYPLSQRVSPFSYSCHFHLPAKMKGDGRETPSPIFAWAERIVAWSLKTALSFTSCLDNFPNLHLSVSVSTINSAKRSNIAYTNWFYLVF